MYKACDLEDVREFMERNPERYYDELEVLDDQDDEDAPEAFASEDCFLLMLPARRRKKDFYAVPKKTDFDLAALERFVQKKSEEFALHLNVDQEKGAKLRFSEPYEMTGPILSLWSEENAETKSEIKGEIRRLKAEDGKYVRGFRGEEGQSMSLKQIFPLLVVDEIGVILAYFDENNRLSAYASYMPIDDEVCAVDSIFVLPELRRRGIGTALAKALLDEALGEAKSCYWPAAESEAALKTARAAGFRVTAERLTVETF